MSGTPPSNDKSRFSDCVSSRGKRALNPVLPYKSAFFEALEDPCDISTNPMGRIALCVAENKLCLDELSQRLSRPDVAETVFADSSNFCYNDMRGMYPVRESFARFLSRNFLKVEDDGSEESVKSKDLIIGSGCTGLLNWLFYCLCEEGDAVLIPAPYYAAFESDMKSVAKCVPFPVQMSNPTSGPSKQDLETAYHKASKLNFCVKMVLLTNPNNPLGIIYSAEVINTCIVWARERRIHTVVDEIYGLSVHDKEITKFQSVIKVLNNQLGDDVHFLWALSKDFGSSGFRLGVLYTQNMELNNAYSNLNMFSCVSNPMQAIAANLLDDTEFIDEFLDVSREKLRSSYKIVATSLDEINIPYIKAEAAMFVYCDFSSLLRNQTFEGESEFAFLLQNSARIVLTPGHSQRDLKPGMLRICYAWVSPEILQLAMERLKLVAHHINNLGWESIHESMKYSSKIFF